MSNFGRNLALWVIIALLRVVLFNLFQPGAGHSGATQMPYSDFVTDVNAGRVRDVVIQGHIVNGTLQDSRTFQTYTPDDPSLVNSRNEEARTSGPSDICSRGPMRAESCPERAEKASITSVTGSNAAP